MTWFKAKPTKEEGRPTLDSDPFIYDLLLNTRGTFDLDDMFQQVAGHVGESLRVDRCLVYLSDEEADALRWRAGYQAPGIDTVRWAFRAPDFPDLFKRLRDGQTVRVNDPLRDPMMRSGRALFQREKRALLLFVPAVSDRLESVILVNHGSTPREWTELELRWLEVIALEMAIAARAVRLSAAARGAELQLQNSSLEFERQTQSLQQLTHVLLHAGANPVETFNRFAEFLVGHLCVTACSIEEINEVMVNVRSFHGLGRTTNLGVSSIRGTPREQVLSTKKLVVLSTTGQEFPQDRFLSENNLRFYIGMPVQSRSGQLIGLLNLYHTGELRVSEQDRNLLQAMARRIAFEMENESSAVSRQPLIVSAEPVTEDQRPPTSDHRLLALEALRQVRQWLRLSDSLDIALQQSIDLATEFVAASLGAIVLFDAERQITQLIAAGLEPGVQEAISRLPVGKGLLGLLTEQEEPLRLDNLIDQPVFDGFPSNHPAIKSFLGVSIRARNRVLGAIYFADKTPPAGPAGEPFTDEDVDFVSELAAEMALALFPIVDFGMRIADLEKEAAQSAIRNPQSAIPEGGDLQLLPLTEAIMTNLSHGLVAVDRDGRITLFNSVMEQIIGYGQADVLGSQAGETYLRFLSGSNPFATVLETGQEVSSEEMALLCSDGGRKLVAAKIAPLRDETGATVGALGLFSELTEVRLTEQDQRLAPLGLIAEMAARLAHEIKNPLASMMSGLELLQRRLSYGGQEGRYFERLIAELKRLDMTLREMLAFSRPAPLSFVPVDPTEPLERALESVEPQIDASHVRLIRSYAPDLPAVTMDQNQMQQVFLNLVLNAIQAMPEGGTLRVSVRPITSPDWEQKFGAAGPFVEYSIQDTGPGIPANLVAKIFDPFFSTKTHGTGLGLATVKKIIDGHQGFMSVKSQPGGGTTFFIQLKPEGPTTQTTNSTN